MGVTFLTWAFIMSDEDYADDTSQTSKKGSLLKPGQSKGKGELDEQLREYINEWRKQRSAEEDELNRLRRNKPNARRSELNKKRNWLNKRRKKKRSCEKLKLKKEPQKKRRNARVWKRLRRNAKSSSDYTFLLSSYY